MNKIWSFYLFKISNLKLYILKSDIVEKKKKKKKNVIIFRY